MKKLALFFALFAFIGTTVIARTVKITNETVTAIDCDKCGNKDCKGCDMEKKSCKKDGKCCKKGDNTTGEAAGAKCSHSDEKKACCKKGEEKGCCKKDGKHEEKKTEEAPKQ